MHRQVAGDLNIPTPPRNTALAMLYSGSSGTGEFREAWEARVCVTDLPCDTEQGGPATQGGGKIDYIFADRWNFLIPVGRATTNTDVGQCEQDGEMKPCSDHYLSYAELLMPR